jgi:hypothetical protein
MQVPHETPNEVRSKIALLQEYVDKSIKDIGNKRKINQRRATVVKMLILCMSGGATILLGLNLGPSAEVSLKNVAFALSSLVTVFNALEPFFNYRALWLAHERANADFFQVKDRLNFYVTGRTDAELDSKQIDSYYAEYESVWTTLNQAWSQQRLLADGGVKQNPK